jgi:hypothetical protein
MYRNGQEGAQRPDRLVAEAQAGDKRPRVVRRTLPRRQHLHDNVHDPLAMPSAATDDHTLG